MSFYCDIAPGHPVHGPYHDTEYGFPSRDERVIFERLALEIMQAGLSWEIVLKKRSALSRAFHAFDPEAVAGMGPADVELLLQDASIIRNRRKIEAIIENARRVLAIRSACGGMALWLDSHHPRSKAEWVKLFRQTFRFTGGEIVGEFLMSLGYLPGAHRPDCPVFGRIRALSRPEGKATRAVGHRG